MYQNSHPILIDLIIEDRLVEYVKINNEHCVNFKLFYIIVGLFELLIMFILC